MKHDDCCCELTTELVWMRTLLCFLSATRDSKQLLEHVHLGYRGVSLADSVAAAFWERRAANNGGVWGASKLKLALNPPSVAAPVQPSLYVPPTVLPSVSMQEQIKAAQVAGADEDPMERVADLLANWANLEHEASEPISSPPRRMKP
jgi:hypothetical protein